MKEFFANLIERFFPQAKQEDVIDIDTHHQSANAWPDEWSKGLIKTMNNMGVMVTDLGPAERAFCEFAAKANKPVLDLGCAYGVATRVALSKNARVIACDNFEPHLKILKESIPQEWHKNLKTARVSFPDEMRLKNESLSAILAANFFNYLTPEAVTAGLKKCYDWLEPGGMIWITCYTPYFYIYMPFSEIYDRKLTEGNAWPGQFRPHQLPDDPWHQVSPQYMQLFKKPEAERILKDAGFDVVASEYFAYEFVKRHLSAHNNREFVMVVGKKA